MAERQTGPVLETRPGMGETVDLVRAHDIREIKVRNPEGDGLGDITDVAIDRRTGCIAYAVLAYGGILGFGEKHFAIPWEAVQVRPREKMAIVDTDKRTLDRSSGFSRDRMPNEGDWSLIRTAPAQMAMGTSRRGAGEVTPSSRMEREAPPVESTTPGGERDLPPQPAVQTVAGGWGGQPTGRVTEERPARAEARPGGAVVEEIRREEPVRPEIRPVTEETRPVAETRPEEVVTTRRTEVRETVAGETRPMAEAEPSTLMTPGPSAGRLTASGLLAYLGGTSYPAGRQDLIDHARQNNAPEGAITVLEEFNDRTYRSATDVSEEFGSIARTRQPTGIEAAVPEVREEAVQVETVREEAVRAETVVEERPETRRVAPSPVHLSAADLQVYLKGMDYPAGRQDLITHARGRSAPESVTTVLERFSDRTYRSAADVSAEFGSEARGEHPARTVTEQATGIGAKEVRREEMVGREEMVRPETVTREQPARTETVVEEPSVTRRAEPSLAHLSPIDLQTYLKGTDYPAEKRDLIDQARKNNAPDDVIAALELFSDRTYRSTTEVSTEFGNIK
jgi:sporulation protein YlmC with PRC-barrel domain